MGATCILGVDDNRILKDFVRAHVELLAGPKVLVGHWYPDYRHDGKRIRDFWSTSPARTRLAKLLPQAIYTRTVGRKSESDAAVHDAFAAFFAAHGVDLILAEFGTNGASITRHARRLGIPLVVHFHGHDAHRISVVESNRAAYQEMFDYAHRIISVSNYMTETLVSLGADRSKVVHNPYGPRDSFFSVEPDYSPTVLAVGRFTDIKANHLTLAAFREALRDVPDAKLNMVGDGELLETCKSLARVWDIESSVSFPGAIPHADVVKEYSHACCFAQHSITPSYGDAEGTPVAILEAGAAALPVIATRHAGIPDVVVEGVTGFLVDEGDVDAMAKRMTELLSDSALARTMGTAARAHVRESYSMGRHIAVLQEIMDSARAQQ
jgi:glycosyltransferase involved in cell wall biosynthesis